MTALLAMAFLAGTVWAVEPPKRKMTTDIPEGSAAPDKVEMRVGSYGLRDGIPKEITTPDHVQSKIGDLDFKDGFPTQETANKISDELDSGPLCAFRKGLADVGIKEGDFFYTSKMLDSKSLLLTANADTVYFWGNLNLSA